MPSTPMAIARHVSLGWKLMNYVHGVDGRMVKCQSPADVLLLYMDIWYRWPCSAGDIATTMQSQLYIHSVLTYCFAKLVGQALTLIMLCKLALGLLT